MVGILSKGSEELNKKLKVIESHGNEMIIYDLNINKIRLPSLEAFKEIRFLNAYEDNKT